MIYNEQWLCQISFPAYAGTKGKLCVLLDLRGRNWWIKINYVLQHIHSNCEKAWQGLLGYFFFTFMTFIAKNGTVCVLSSRILWSWFRWGSLLYSVREFATKLEMFWHIQVIMVFYCRKIQVKNLYRMQNNHVTRPPF